MQSPLRLRLRGHLYTKKPASTDTAGSLLVILLVVVRGDKYLNDAPMYRWCDEVRASFDVMRKVGHMPQEDFPEETAKFAAAFFESEGKVSALGSVRLGKIGKDDDYDR